MEIFLDTNMILAKKDFEEIDNIKLKSLKGETIFRGVFIQLVDLVKNINDISIKYTDTIFNEVLSQLNNIKKRVEENEIIDIDIKQIIIRKIDNSVSYIQNHNNNNYIIENDESTVSFISNLKSQGHNNHNNDLSISIEINNFIDINENLNKNNVVLLTTNLKDFSHFKVKYSLNRFVQTGTDIKIEKIDDIVNHDSLYKQALEKIKSSEGEDHIVEPLSGITFTFYTVKYSKIQVTDNSKANKEITYLANLKINYDIIQGDSRIEKYIYIDAIHFEDNWKITDIRGFRNRTKWL